MNDLLLMPASRAEIYVRNDNQDPPHSDEQVYILRTKGLDAGSDVWPEIQLARVVLKPTKAVSSIALALNAPVGQIRVQLALDKTCSEPDYKFYEERSKTCYCRISACVARHYSSTHGQDVFLIMSFDAKEQIGRFVFHCHILKHEDNGLMAPIEVWDPSAVRVDR